MITVYLNWRSQLKGIYENSRLMLIWQSRCRIPILLVHSALVYNICFPVSFSLSLSSTLSSLSLSFSLPTSFTIHYYFLYIILKIYIIRQLAFYDCWLWLLIEMKENSCMCHYTNRKVYLKSIETIKYIQKLWCILPYLVHHPKFT